MFLLGKWQKTSQLCCWCDAFYWLLLVPVIGSLLIICLFLLKYYYCFEECYTPTKKNLETWPEQFIKFMTFLFFYQSFHMHPRYVIRPQGFCVIKVNLNWLRRSAVREKRCLIHAVTPFWCFLINTNLGLKWCLCVWVGVFICVFTRESETTPYLPPAVTGLRGSLMLKRVIGPLALLKRDFKWLWLHPH